MNELMQLINEERKRQRIGEVSFSRRCGFGPNAFYQYMHGVQPPVNKVDRMLRELGLTFTLGATSDPQAPLIDRKEKQHEV